MRKVKGFFLPTHYNGFRPHSLRIKFLSILVIGILVSEGGFLFYIFGLLQTSPHFNVANVVSSGITSKLETLVPEVLIEETNEFRSSHNLTPVSENQTLALAAQMKAEDMATKGYFSHQGPEGEMPWQWMARAHYDYRYAGENLAVNFVEPTEVTKAWIASPPHEANLLNDRFTDIGIGIAKGIYNGRETFFIVQFFGSKKQDRVEETAVRPHLASAISSPAPTPHEEAATTSVATSSLASLTPTPPEPHPIVPAATIRETTPSNTLTLSLLKQPRKIVFSILLGLFSLLLVILAAPLIHTLTAYLRKDREKILPQPHHIFSINKTSAIAAFSILIIAGALALSNIGLVGTKTAVPASAFGSVSDILDY